MEPRHISEVKQVLKCLAVQKCSDLIRILLRLTSISDFQAREREQQEKLILGKCVWIPVCGRRKSKLSALDFSKEVVSPIRAFCKMSIPGLQNSL